MDFHSLARKELQALCKLNKIPANMTNIAMADALKSLEIVEGIEDFLNPSESVTAESSIDSPERNVVTSQKVPPTGRRTSTRRKPVGEESDSVQIMTKSTRRMPRRAISGEIMEEAKADIPKTPAVRSSKKTVPDAAVSRMEIQSKEDEVSQAPVVEPNSRRKGAAVLTRRNNLKKEEEVGTVQRVYSTRRSARLTDKKLMESIPMKKDMNKAVKIDLISSEISANDMDEVSDIMSESGNDSQTVLQESVNKSDSVDSEIVRDTKDNDVEDETGDNEVDEPKAILEEISEALNESDVVKSESAGDVKNFYVQEESGDKHEVSNEVLDLTEVLVDENMEEKAFDMQNQILTNKENSGELLELEIEESLNADMDLDSEEKAAADMKTDVIESEVEMFPMDTENPHEQLKLETTEEFNSGKDKESDVLATVVSSFGEDTVADSDFKKIDGEKEPTISEILNCNDPKENADQQEINSIDSYDELDSEKSLTKVSSFGEDAVADSDFKKIDGEKEPTISEILNCNDPKENADQQEINSIDSSDELDSEKSLTKVSSFGEDAVADSDFKKINSEKKPTISEIPNCNDPKENADQQEINSIDSSDELDSEKSLTKELGSEVAATDLSVQEDVIIAMGTNDANETKSTREQLSKSPASVKGNVFASLLADDPLTNQFSSSVFSLGHVASPIRSTPVKKSSTKTPTIKRLNNVSDDKENIDHSGRKFELTKEKAKTNKKENALNDKQKAALNEKSLRELTKLLKEKLQISNNTSEEAKDEKLTAKVTKARPALQKLSENCLVASNIEN